MSVGAPSDTGVQVPTGDPGRLLSAASWHFATADGLDAHAGTVSSAAASVAPTWQGESAAAYQTLSGLVADHFRAAASTARTAAQTLRRYGTELERLQQQGRQALQQAEHWLAEVRTWTTRLTAADAAVITAQGQVTAAQGELRTAVSLDARGAALAAAAQARLSAAQGALTRAQTEQRRAQRELQNAQHQLSHWQQRGRQIWHEAQSLAVQATGELAPLSVPAPPLASAATPATWLPQSPFEWAGVGVSGVSGYWASRVAQQLPDAINARSAARGEYYRLKNRAESPLYSSEQRAAAASQARELAPGVAAADSEVSGLAQAGRFASRSLGFLGGAGDAAVHLAQGDGAGKSAGAGLGSTVGGVALGAMGAAACGPPCAAAGAVVGGFVGDKMGGALGGLVDDL